MISPGLKKTSTQDWLIEPVDRTPLVDLYDVFSNFKITQVSFRCEAQRPLIARGVLCVNWKRFSEHPNQ